jgi:hypothetical protein
MKEWPVWFQHAPAAAGRAVAWRFTCVPDVKNLVSRAKTFLRSHLTQIDQMKDSPTA